VWNYRAQKSGWLKTRFRNNTAIPNRVILIPLRSIISTRQVGNKTTTTWRSRPFIRGGAQNNLVSY
jgi:hypothetical protein